MSTQNISFINGTTGDTGEGDPLAILPYSTGEALSQAVMRRADANLQSRTEFIRSAINSLQYLSEADRRAVLYGGGTVTWGGASDLSGTGILTISAQLNLRPFLASRTATQAQITIGPSGIGTGVQITGVAYGTGGAWAGINAPRAYNGANTITVQVATAGSNSVVVSGTPIKNILITLTAATTEAGLIALLNGTPAFTNLGLVAQAGVNYSGTTTMGGVVIAATAMSGAVDSELHSITQAGLAAFFSTTPTTIASGSNAQSLPQATIYAASTANFPAFGTMSVVTGAGTQTVTYTGITAGSFTGCIGGTGTMTTGGAITPAGNVMAQGDTLAIYYPDLVDSGATYNGRRQSMQDSPEVSNIADAKLFLLRKYPQYLPLALPIATVVDGGSLIFINDFTALAAVPTTIQTSFVQTVGDTMTGQLIINAPATNISALSATGGANYSTGAPAPGVITTGGLSASSLKAGAAGLSSTGGSTTSATFSGGAGVIGFGGAAAGINNAGAGAVFTGNAPTTTNAVGGPGAKAIGGTGNGTGAGGIGLVATGGAQGSGLPGVGATLTGGYATSGAGAAGASALGTGASPGIITQGGTSAGGTAAGLNAAGGTGSDGPGVIAQGDGIGQGVLATGGATASGVKGIAGTSGAAGVHGVAGASGSVAIYGDASGGNGSVIKTLPNAASATFWDIGLSATPTTALSTGDTALHMYWDTTLQCLRRWDPTLYDFANTHRGGWTHSKYFVNGGSGGYYATSLYNSNWTDSGTSPHLYGFLQIWKDLEGCVHFEGGCHWPNPPGGTPASLILTLPAGWRPATSVWFGYTATSESGSGNVISVSSSTGQMTLLDTTNTDLCLTGLIYSTS